MGALIRHESPMYNRVYFPQTWQSNTLSFWAPGNPYVFWIIMFVVTVCKETCHD